MSTEVTISLADGLAKQVRENAGDRPVADYVTRAVRGQVTRDGGVRYRQLLDANPELAIEIADARAAAADWADDARNSAWQADAA